MTYYKYSLNTYTACTWVNKLLKLLKCQNCTHYMHYHKIASIVGDMYTCFLSLNYASFAEDIMYVYKYSKLFFFVAKLSTTITNEKRIGNFFFVVIQYALNCAAPPSKVVHMTSCYLLRPKGRTSSTIFFKYKACIYLF